MHKVFVTDHQPPVRRFNRRNTGRRAGKRAEIDEDHRAIFAGRKQ